MAIIIPNRIVGLERIRAKDLIPHPDNWRIHPDNQREALSRMLHRIGYVGAVVARQLPNGKYQIIDGHLRAELTPNNRIPVLVVEISEREARELLASGDVLANMANTDLSAFNTLIKGIDPQTARILLEIGDYDFKVERAGGRKSVDPGVERGRGRSDDPGRQVHLSAVRASLRGNRRENWIPIFLWH